MTVQEIIDRAGSKRESCREGCFLVDPPVRLFDRTENCIVHACAVDVDGKYPNTVKIREYDFWWDLGRFEFPDSK